MKKILAIALAMVMVLACSVAVFADYTLTNAQGQDTEDAIDGGLAIASSQGDDYCRLATNWVGGGSVYNEILEAVKVDGASIKITYTGTLTMIGFQTEQGSYEMVEITNVTEVDGKNVAIVSCADLIAAAPVAIANDNVGWGNFMVQYVDSPVLYSLEVGSFSAPAADPEPAPADPEPAPAPAADPEPAPAPAPSTNTAPATGLALAVVPAVVAMAAVAVSKKH